MTNLDFSNSIMYDVNVVFSDLNNVKFNENYYDDVSGINFSINEKRKFDTNYIDLQTEKFSNPQNIDLNIKFENALDKIPINWSMDLDIQKEKLYVSDTDNHRINVYHIDTLELLSSFTSPSQHSCNGAHTWNDKFENCPPEIRNLPTSSAILDDKIFVAYGFQNEIQVFDIIDKNFLFKFGNFGTDDGEFDNPIRVTTSSNQLFVADSNNHRIQIFDLDGNFINQFNTNTNSISNSTPYDLKIYENKIFVLDNTNSSILVFDLDGNFIKTILIDDDIISDPVFTGMDVIDNLIMITESGNNVIIILDLDGNLIMKFGNSGNQYGQFNSPFSITSDGNRIFISDVYNYRIQIFELVR